MFLVALITAILFHPLLGKTSQGREDDVPLDPRSSPVQLMREHQNTKDSAFGGENHEPILHHSTVFIDCTHQNTPKADGTLSVDSNNLPLNLAHLHPSQIQQTRNTTQSSVLQQALNAKTPLNTKRLSESVVQNPGMVGLHQSILIHQDKEASNINEMARHVPIDCIKQFKTKFVALADMLALASKILNGLCAATLTISAGDYITNSGFISDSTKIQLAVLSGIGCGVFSKIESLLIKIKIRDELRLMSYSKTEEFNRQKELELGDGRHYTNEEVLSYLKKNNKFIALPSQNSAKARYFLFNSMCFLESFLAMMSSFSGGMSAAAGMSGILDQNLLGLSSVKMYRDLTIILGVVTAILYTLDKKRADLKEYCENWIQNYEMLCLYFILFDKIEKKKLYDAPRFSKHDFLEEITENISELGTHRSMV